MNKLNKVAFGTALTISTLGGAQMLDSEAVEARGYEQIDQGLYPIPYTCSDLVGVTVNRDAERALRKVGYTGIRVDGIVSSETEQEAVLGAQIHMKEIGVLPESQDICGYAGSITLNAANKMLRPSNLASESQVQEERTKKTSKSESSRYTLEDCKRQDEWSIDTIKAVQRALGVASDGIFGNITCNAMINFQEKNGIAQYGKGFLGPRTLGALGVTNAEKKSDNSSVTNRKAKNISNGIVEGCEGQYNTKYIVCADTGPGKETGYLYKRIPRVGQKLLREFEITSSQIDVDGPNKNADTLTRKGHHIMGHASRKTPKLGLKNFLQFSGEQGIHYYPIVGAEADSSGCIRVHWDTSVYLYDTLAKHIGNVEVIVK